MEEDLTTGVAHKAADLEFFTAVLDCRTDIAVHLSSRKKSRSLVAKEQEEST